MLANPKLIGKLLGRLRSEERSLLEGAASSAKRRRVSAYVVGGLVRDFLLGRESTDLDVVIEGDARELAADIAIGVGGRLAKVTRFGTATVVAGRASLDLATARTETYSREGALPEVCPATIREDLERRDFSMNAIALGLSGPDAGRLVDPMDGEEDLRRSVVRVLHDKSFRDDPTRILRGVRYEQRFRFRLEPHTMSLLVRDLDAISMVSGSRLRSELERMLSEDTPEQALMRAEALGVLRAIHPALSFDAGQANAMQRLKSTPAPSLVARWAILLLRVSEAVAPDICSRLALTRKQREAVVALPAARVALDSLEVDSPPSEVVRVLDAYPLPTIGALSCVPGRDIALDYLQHLRGVRPALRGEDLQALGVSDGPEMGYVTERLRAARLDGAVESADDEAELVMVILRERSTSLAG